jgi:hypothetical protein
VSSRNRGRVEGAVVQVWLKEDSEDEPPSSASRRQPNQVAKIQVQAKTVEAPGDSLRVSKSS